MPARSALRLALSSLIVVGALALAPSAAFAQDTTDNSTNDSNNDSSVNDSNNGNVTQVCVPIAEATGGTNTGTQSGTNTGPTTTTTPGPLAQANEQALTQEAGAAPVVSCTQIAGVPIFPATTPVPEPTVTVSATPAPFTTVDSATGATVSSLSQLPVGGADTGGA